MTDRLLSANNSANKDKLYLAEKPNQGTHVTVHRILLEVEYQQRNGALGFDNGIPIDELDKETQLSPSLGPPLGISASTLIDMVGYKASKSTLILKQCMLHAQPNANDTRRLTALTQRAVYQSWLKDESQSKALLVHGRSHPKPVVSSLSYLCARIAEENSGRRSTIVLNYFCGMRARDGHASPTDLLCHFVGQLISSKEAAAVYAEDPLERNWTKKLRRRDFDTLLDVFARLIRQLRKAKIVIFCLIDSISKLECIKKERRNIERLLTKLNDLVEHQRSGQMALKLMVTDGGLSLFAHEFFARRDTINMLF